MIYFDNAATGGRKQRAVVQAVLASIEGVCANPGRSGHALAAALAKNLSAARERLCSFFGNTDPDRTVFTRGCTEALNIALFSLPSLQTNGRLPHIVTTAAEHNAVLREGRTIEAHVVVVAAGASAAGNVDHDGALGLAGGRSPDVQAQAVSAADGLVFAAGLQRNVAELDGVDDPVPGRHGLGQGEAVLSFIRRHAAGYASEDVHAVHDKTSHAALGRFDDRAFRRMSIKGHGAHESHGRASV